MTDTNSAYGSDYTAKLKSVGIALLVMGVLSMIFDIVSVAVWVNAGYTLNNAPGIYTGIVAIVTGSLNVSASKNASNCNMIAGLIFAILLCFFSAFMTYWEATAILLAQRLQVSVAMATHSLTVLDAIGIFITAVFSCVFNQKARSAGAGS